MNDFEKFTAKTVAVYESVLHNQGYLVHKNYTPLGWEIEFTDTRDNGPLRAFCPADVRSVVASMLAKRRKA